MKGIYLEGTENIPGQSAVYRSPTATDIELSGIKEENPKDLKTLFTIKLEEHADRLCLGHRPKIVKEVINEETKEIKTEVSFGEYEWITYRYHFWSILFYLNHFELIENI